MSSSAASRRPRADWDYYQPSNRMGPSTIPAALGVMVVAAGAAFVYQRITMWMPLIYVNFLIAGGLGAGIGWLMAEAFLKTHGRARATAAGLAAAAALAAFVASFFAGAVYLRSELTDQVQDLKRQAALEGSVVPEDDVIAAEIEKLSVKDFIDNRVEAGWTVGRRSGKGPEISGILVWVVWLAELGLIAGGAYFMANKRMDRVYCEECKRFCDIKRVATLRHLDPRAVHSALGTGTVDALLAIPSDDRRAPPIHVEAHVCGKSCPAWLDVSTLGAPSKKGGKPERVPLLVHAGVPSATLARVAERAKQKSDDGDAPQAPVRSRRPKPPDV